MLTYLWFKLLVYQTGPEGREILNALSVVCLLSIYDAFPCCFRWIFLFHYALNIRYKFVSSLLWIIHHSRFTLCSLSPCFYIIASSYLNEDKNVFHYQDMITDLVLYLMDRLEKIFNFFFCLVFFFPSWNLYYSLEISIMPLFHLIFFSNNWLSGSLKLFIAFDQTNLFFGKCYHGTN